MRTWHWQRARCLDEGSRRRPHTSTTERKPRMAVTERGMASITAEFAHPDADHSPAAYWFWHRLPTKAEIRHQIGGMLSGGFRSFQIQPRLAYPIDDYLGEDYLPPAAQRSPRQPTSA